MEEIKNLPNFIICGTQKGGTTSLYNYFKEIPLIGMPLKKEIHFFDLNYEKGVEWYKKYFEVFQNKQYKLIGEATPSYMYFEEVPKRIFKVIPNTKLIFMLRDPIERAYSHYWHTLTRGYENLSFEEAIEIEEKRISNNSSSARLRYSYIDRGKYIVQLKRFWKYFPKEQMLILITEELKEKPDQIKKQISNFLDLDIDISNQDWNTMYYKGQQPHILGLQKFLGLLPDTPICNYLRSTINHFNLKDGYPSMNPDTKQKLIRYFEPYNKELENALGKKLTSWKRENF
jgi:hypothetical protein